MRLNASDQNIQYPSPTGPYKVFVADKGIWRGFTAARLQISVGNPRHNGDKFFALTEWAAARFDNVTLIVSDSLQRHNLALEQGIDLDAAHQVSLLNGQRWLKENKAAIDNLAPSQRVITHWDDWMKHPDYAAVREKIENLYQKSDSFRNAVAMKAQNFCERRADLGKVVQDRCIQTSIEYLLEEIAVFGIMFHHERAVDIYPGTWFKEVFQEISQGEDKDALLSGYGDVSCLSVDFIKNKVVQMNKQA